MERDRSPNPFISRRQFFIDPSFRGKLLLGILAATLLSLLLLVFDYYIFFGRNVPTSPWDPQMIWLFMKAHWPVIVQLIVFVFVLVAVTMILSHRVAGPIHSLERSIHVVQTGNLVHRVRFRKRDELSHLRDAFNAMLDATHAKVVKDRDAVSAARREIEPLLHESALDADAKAKLEQIKTRLEGVTRGFTL